MYTCRNLEFDQTALRKVKKKLFKCTKKCTDNFSLIIWSTFIVSLCKQALIEANNMNLKMKICKDC